MSKPQITYLLGAGASSQALPMAAELKEKITQINNELKEIQSSDTHIVDIVKEIEWLLKQVEGLPSIDTYAKRLTLNGASKDLQRLKLVLSLSLFYLQCGERPDPRYEVFLTTLLKTPDSRSTILNENPSIVLPDNISVISWNYDCQLEIALMNIFPFLESIGSWNKIGNELNLLDATPTSREVKSTAFNLVKINGSASNFTLYDEKVIPINLLQAQPKEIVEQLCRGFLTTNGKGTFDPIVHFAWEKNEWNRKVRESAKNICQRTNYLIVIGYSFPTFNRDIDLEHFKEMRQLKKIFIQAPKGDLEGLKSRVSSLLPNETDIELISDIKQFYIPYQFLA